MSDWHEDQLNYTHCFTYLTTTRSTTISISCFLFLSLRVLRPGFWLDAVALQARMPMQRTPGRRHAWPHLRWNFGLGFDHTGLHFLYPCFHLLLGCNRRGQTTLSFRLTQFLVRFCTLGFEQRAHVGNLARSAHTGDRYVSYVDRHDFEGCIRV